MLSAYRFLQRVALVVDGTPGETRVADGVGIADIDTLRALHRTIVGVSEDFIYFAITPQRAVDRIHEPPQQEAS